MHHNQRGRPASIDTRNGILYSLKREGPSDSQTLASRLHLSAMAVRQHLYVLRNEKLVTYEEEPRPFGRPAKVYRLTPAADRFFFDGHAELALALLDSVRSLFGKGGLSRLFSENARRQAAAYKKRIPKLGTLKERVEALAAILNDRGFLVELGTTGDDGLLLIENHCPIRTAASIHDGCCRAELEVLELLFGPAVRVERIEHVPNGMRRCVYRISALR